MTHQLKFDHQLGLPFSELWLLNPSSRSSNERSGKCKRCLKFSRNDQIIAKSGYSAARPVFCVPNFTVPVSSSGSTSLLAGVDAILMANNICWDPDFLFFDGLLFPGLGRAGSFLSPPLALSSAALVWILATLSPPPPPKNSLLAGYNPVGLFFSDELQDKLLIVTGPLRKSVSTNS